MFMSKTNSGLRIYLSDDALALVNATVLDSPEPVGGAVRFAYWLSGDGGVTIGPVTAAVQRHLPHLRRTPKRYRVQNPKTREVVDDGWLIALDASALPAFASLPNSGKSLVTSVVGARTVTLRFIAEELRPPHRLRDGAQPAKAAKAAKAGIAAMTTEEREREVSRHLRALNTLLASFRDRSFEFDWTDGKLSLSSKPIVSAPRTY